MFTTYMSFGLAALLATGLFFGPASDSTVADKASKGFYDFTVKDIDGKEVSLDRYRGQVCLVVNVASR